MQGFPAINRLSLLVGVIMLMMLTACSEQNQQAQVVRLSGPTMGTQYNVSWVAGKNQPSPKELQGQIDSRLLFLNSVFSTYDPQSELSLLNKHSADWAGQWVDVSPELMSVLRDAAHVYEYSGGKFDPTVGPLVNLWGFGPAYNFEVPPKENILELLSQVGMDKVTLNPETHQVKLSSAVYIDLSALAKGWAVDDLGLLLEAQGISDYLVEIGGEIRVRGKKPTGEWRIAIESPAGNIKPGTAVAQKIIQPSGWAIATSGDYRNYFEQDGVRYSHTIDPQTGYPIKHHLASVTLIMPTCSMADAWATALEVAGPDAGMALAELNNLPVFMIVREGEEFKTLSSSAFDLLFGEASEKQTTE